MLHIDMIFIYFRKNVILKKVDPWGIWLVGYNWMTFLGDGFSCQREALSSRI